MLIANFLHGAVTNVSIHHNIFYQNYQRSPEISTPGLFDFRNNCIYGFTEYGTRVRQAAWGNFESNYYIGGKKDPMVFVNESAQLSFLRANSWKFDYFQWRVLNQSGTVKYNVPYVITYDLPRLIIALRKWGCQAQTSIEREIKGKIQTNLKTNTKPTQQ